VVTPGVYDTPGALPVAEAGFETAYLSGASLSNSGSTALNRPRMVDSSGLNDLLGTKAFLKTGKSYQPEEK
jgi:hypothetical protein